jgi:hypothetical protein
MAFSLLCDLHDLRCRTELQSSLAASLLLRWREESSRVISASGNEEQEPLRQDTEACLLTLVDLSAEVSDLRKRLLRLKRCMLFADLLFSPVDPAEELIVPDAKGKEERKEEKKNSDKIYDFTFKALEAEVMDLGACDDSIEQMMTLLLSLMNANETEEEERAIRNYEAEVSLDGRTSSFLPSLIGGPVSPLSSRVDVVDSR